MWMLRGTWAAAAVLGLVVAVRAAGPSGRVVLLTVAGLLAAIAAMMVLGWVEDARRWSWAAQAAAWTFPACVVVLGLPVLIGAWTGVVVLVMVPTCPPVLDRARREYRLRRPVRAGRQARRLSEPELERRWRRTSQELQHAVEDASRLRLVCERAVLLDEIERRDPSRFAARLERAGWPTSGATAPD